MLRRIIDRPVAVTMVMLAVVVLGIVSIRLLPVSLIPDVSIPFITVQTSSPGMSAREVEQSLLRPLRQQLVQMNGLQDMSSEARDGSGSIKLTFDNGADMDYLFIEANEKIDRAMSSLPDVQRPKVMKASATDLPAFFVNITGDAPSAGSDAWANCLPDSSFFPVGQGFASMSRFVQDVIARRLEQLPEVAMVDITGLVSDELIIIPDEEKLRQADMTVDDLETAVRYSDIRLGSLTIRDGEYRYDVKFDTRSTSAKDIASIWINWNGRLMQVGDLAQVFVHPAGRDGLVRSDGEDAVCLAVVKQSDARMADLRKAMSALTDNFAAEYPSLSFKVTRDQTRLLEYSINSLLKNIILAVLLACLVIVVFMRDLRSPLLVALSIPVSLVFSMLCFHLVGMSINIVSLTGLILGVGMMTDNTVVLIDNITGRWISGDDLRTAVVEGTKEVMGPMFSSMLTTCVVFIPLVFMNGMAGALFKDQALSVTIVLLTSYVVTVTVIPVFYYWWYKGRERYTPSRLLQRLDLTPHLLKWDERWMKSALKHKPLCWGLLGISAVVAAAAIAWLPKERLPEMTQTDAILRIDWNESIPLEVNSERARSLETLLDGKASQVTSLVGSQQFILEHTPDQSLCEASVYFDCGDAASLSEAEKILSETLAGEYPLATFSFAASGNVFDMVFGGSSTSELTVRLLPTGGREVKVETVRPLLAQLRSRLPGVRIDEPALQTDVLFLADPELMALYGVSSSDLASALGNALNGNTLLNIVQGSRTLPVVLGTDKGDIRRILDEVQLDVRDRNGMAYSIPASSLMKQTFIEDFKTLVAGQDGACYTLNLDIPARSVPSAVSAVREVVRNDGHYEAAFSGSWFSGRRLAGDMFWVLLVALGLLYLILASQFESLVQPLVILSEIVIDIAVSLLALAAFGISLNVMSLIGLVVITGIVINDSILKVDTINRLRRSGMGLDNAVLEASSRRMKAILMTSLTTILAVCPFLSRGDMGSDLQYPMSVVIIVGMTVGTLVSLFIVPALYHSIYNGRKG